MQRNMDLIREMLLYIESSNSVVINLYDTEFKINEQSTQRNIIMYHADMLKNAEFIIGSTNSNSWLVQKITWKGHELLDNIRNPTRWQLIKSMVAKAGTFSLAVLYSKASEVASNQLDSLIKKLMND